MFGCWCWNISENWGSTQGRPHSCATPAFYSISSFSDIFGDRFHLCLSGSHFLFVLSFYSFLWVILFVFFVLETWFVTTQPLVWKIRGIERFIMQPWKTLAQKHTNKEQFVHWCWRRRQTRVFSLPTHTHTDTRTHTHTQFKTRLRLSRPLMSTFFPPCLAFTLTQTHTRTSWKPSGQANCIRQP